MGECPSDAEMERERASEHCGSEHASEPCVAACVGMTYEASLRAEMRIDETYMAPSEMRHSCPYRPDVNMTKQ